MLVLLVSCGGGRSTAGLAAVVGSRSITRAQLNEYVRYALSFYGWTSGTGIGSNDPKCAPGARNLSCKRVRAQALLRLIEETTVLDYAARKKIVLTAEERQQIQKQATGLESHDTTVSQLLTERRITRGFVEELLTREALVQKVEWAVTRSKAAAGMSYHLREYLIPVLPGSTGSKAYNSALTLATDGKPVPPETETHSKWIAEFRAPGTLKSALADSHPGSFVGPFQSGDAYLVVKVMAHRVHPYRRPARVTLEAKYFRPWLDAEVKQARPACYNGTDHAVACPGPIH